MASYNLHRRSLVKKFALLSITLNGISLARVAYANDVSGFENLALFLTGRKYINATYLNQSYQTLLSQNKNLDEALNKLSVAITAQKSTSIEAFMQYLTISGQTELLTTAQQIITALYTGVVGQGEQAQVTNYQMALMFEPALGIMTIPTFVGARPEYWAAYPE